MASHGINGRAKNQENLDEKLRRPQSAFLGLLPPWAYSTVRPESREVVAMSAITEHQSEFLIRQESISHFRIACLWSALGLTLTGLFFALGFGAEFGQILAMAG
jgi:hypothetical protein